MSAQPIRRSRPKKARKPQKRTQELWDAITLVTGEYQSMTVRQLFYQLEQRGYIPKEETAYKQVKDAAVQMRIAGVLPYAKIVDSHRERRRVLQYGDMHEALMTMHEMYRRNIWLRQHVHVEVWCEKDALSGIIEPICREYGVPYVAARGFSSLSLVYESATAIREIGKETVILYFGDHDPSGRKMGDNLEADLNRHLTDLTDPVVVVERVALNPSQIAHYGIRMRPTKKTDSRYREFTAKYGEGSAELDALPPDVLAEMVQSAIEAHIDVPAWNTEMEIEEIERKALGDIAALGWTSGTRYDASEGKGGPE